MLKLLDARKNLALYTEGGFSVFDKKSAKKVKVPKSIKTPKPPKTKAAKVIYSPVIKESNGSNNSEANGLPIVPESGNGGL
jgi:hypothetical protein